MFSYEGEEDAEIIDGTVTQRQEGAQPTYPRYQPAEQATQGRIYTVDESQQYTQDYANQYTAPNGAGVDLTGLVDAGVGIASNPSNRTLALFVKVPLLAYVALSDRMPGLVRLAAAGLGIMEALEAVQRQGELEQYIDQGF